MTKDGQRTEMSHGAMLADPDVIGNAWAPAMPALFDPDYWMARGQLQQAPRGRGSAWFIDAPPRHWALRHYRRGGWIARVSRDRYVWAGEERVRAFAEWHLLRDLRRRGLPVPLPVAACYRRQGVFYRCDLITERVLAAEPLSMVLAARALEDAVWRGIGATLARFHAAGVDHADLNAHNILLQGGGRHGVTLIDFDRGRLRAPGGWASGNLARLRRSLLKISRAMPERFSPAMWQQLLAGYSA